MEGRSEASQCVLGFFSPQRCWADYSMCLQVFISVLIFLSLTRTRTHPSQYKGQAGYSIVCRVNPLCGKFCLCSEVYHAGFFPLAAVLYKLESPWLQSAVHGEHQGVLLALGGAANWGEGYEGSCSSQPDSVQHPCKKQHVSVSDSRLFFFSPRQTLRFGRSCCCTVTQVFQPVLQSTLAATRTSDVQETASEAASALLSAELELWVTREGDTKALTNHFLSPALWSNASLARNWVSCFKHEGAGRPEFSRTVLLLSSWVLLVDSVWKWKLYLLKTGGLVDLCLLFYQYSFTKMRKLGVLELLQSNQG